MSRVETVDPQHSSASKEQRASEGSRFPFIDALRGIAAFGVMLHHYLWFGPWETFGSENATTAVLTVGDLCRNGVPVFFVISGFVIAYSMRKSRITGRFIANFAWRRSLRLDPPYWVTIALVLATNWCCENWWKIDPPTNFPSLAQFFAHVFYLQNILGLGNISVGFWTLCIEIQFYLLFAGMLAIAQWLSGMCRAKEGVPLELELVTLPSLAIVFVPIALASLFHFSRFEFYDDWFLRYYCLFCLGVSIWWSLEGTIPRWVAWVFAGLFVPRLLWENNPRLWSGLLAGLTTLHLGERGLLKTWGTAAPLQFLGRISYSLYLIHYPVGHVVLFSLRPYLGDDPASAAIGIATAMTASLFAAAGFYVAIERPTIRFAAKFKPQRTEKTGA